MAPIVHGFDWPDRLVIGTVGQPGERTFYLQARAGRQLVSVAIEKEQSAALAERIEEILDELMSEDGNPFSVPALTPAGLVDNDPLEQPVEEQFRAGGMGLGWDPTTAQIVIGRFRSSRSMPRSSMLWARQRSRSRSSRKRSWSYAFRLAPPGRLPSAPVRSWEPAGPSARCAAFRWIPTTTSANCPTDSVDRRSR